MTANATWETDRFYVGDTEVTNDVWIRAERSAGFRPKGVDVGQPATGGWSSTRNGVYASGSYRTFEHTPPANNTPRMLRCKNCDRWVVEVQQRLKYSKDAFELVWRHFNNDFDHNLGPIECDIEPVRPVATPIEDDTNSE